MVIRSCFSGPCDDPGAGCGAIPRRYRKMDPAGSGQEQRERQLGAHLRLIASGVEPPNLEELLAGKPLGWMGGARKLSAVRAARMRRFSRLDRGRSRRLSRLAENPATLPLVVGSLPAPARETGQQNRILLARIIHEGHANNPGLPDQERFPPAAGGYWVAGGHRAESRCTGNARSVPARRPQGVLFSSHCSRAPFAKNAGYGLGAALRAASRSAVTFSRSAWSLRIAA